MVWRQVGVTVRSSCGCGGRCIHVVIGVLGCMRCRRTDRCRRCWYDSIWPLDIQSDLSGLNDVELIGWVTQIKDGIADTKGDEGQEGGEMTKFVGI